MIYKFDTLRAKVTELPSDAPHVMSAFPNHQSQDYKFYLSPQVRDSQFIFLQ